MVVVVNIGTRPFIFVTIQHKSSIYRTDIKEGILWYHFIYISAKRITMSSHQTSYKKR